MGFISRGTKSFGLRVSAALGHHPSIYLPLARIKYRWDIRGTELDGMRPNPDAAPPPVGPSVEFVLEGFPRSANSFAVAAFRLAQSRFVHIAHHRHVAAQVIGGVRLRIPTLVLLRDPEDAVLSLIVRQPAYSLNLALKNYIRFYETIWPLHDHFVCATFHEVTTDFGTVIHAVNKQFGTRFGVFHHTPAKVQECFARIEENHHRQFGRKDIRQLTIPSKDREALKNRYVHEFHSDRLEPLRRHAHALFGAFQAQSSEIT